VLQDTTVFYIENYGLFKIKYIVLHCIVLNPYIRFAYIYVHVILHELLLITPWIDLIKF